MKMPFEKMKLHEAQALGRMAADATVDVTCDGETAMIVGLDSDMQPTANVNDARMLVVRFPVPTGVAVAVVKISNAGLMSMVGSHG